MGFPVSLQGVAVNGTGNTYFSPRTCARVCGIQSCVPMLQSRETGNQAKEKWIWDGNGKAGSVHFLPVCLHISGGMNGGSDTNE